MLDLHLHTNHSDGKLSVADTLSAFEKNGYTAISITDHDSISAYQELLNPEIRKLFKGKILIGCEVTALVNGVLIHMLAYGFDLGSAKKYLREIPLKPYVGQYVVDKTNENFKKLGIADELVYSGGSNPGTDYVTDFKKILQNNKDKVADTVLEYTMGLGNLWWGHFTDKESIFYVDFSGIYPSWQQAIKDIKKCNGLVVLAHPYTYKNNMGMIIDTLIDYIDGMECFRNGLSENQMSHLISIAESRNLIIVGGSDWHGCTTGKDIIRHPKNGFGNMDANVLGQFTGKMFI